MRISCLSFLALELLAGSRNGCAEATPAPDEKAK
jgi:hypothetical protein